MSVSWIGNDPVSVRQFDVAAKFCKEPRGFVRHLGYFSVPHLNLIQGMSVSITHMAPPLEHTDKVDPEAVGRVPLTSDEIAQIDLWICDRFHEINAVQKRKQYLVRPHAKVEYGTDGTTKYQRFSCAGFVIEGLREVGVDLIETNETRLPKVSWKTLVTAYPQLKNADRILVELGLNGNGPWPVVLCGYVMQSLDRPEGEIRRKPYRPVSGDEVFHG